MTTRQYSSRSQQTTLTGAITSGASSITVVSGSALLGGVSIPAGRTFTLVIDPDTALEEIVDATVVSTNNFTINRGIDGSSPQDHSAGAIVRHMAIGRDFRDANLHAEADASYNDGSGNAHTMHGISAGEGVVVGTDKAQTLTQKTLTTPTINGGTLAGAVTVSATATVSGHIVVSGGTITGLSSAGMVTTSAVPRSYVDDIFGSATAASTSAASAALSASQASTSAASASASATAASTSAVQASTSAASASVSQIAANTSRIQASTSAASASVSQIAANTSAVNASTSAASASVSQIAANTSRVQASTSAASASASAVAANTSAIAASTSAASASVSQIAANTSAIAASTSAASADVSAIAANTSAINASTSAASASVSQIAANTSAIAASTSAASASASATAASTSAAQAAASFDAFDDTYLGAKATDPTLDNDGNALITGALYFNTASDVLKVYDGGAWVNAPQGPAGISAGIPWTFSTTTTKADPGNGFFRFNNATIGSVTEMYISETDADGAARTGLFGTWNSSTNTVKGTLTFAIVTGGTPVLFDITGAIVDEGAYRTIPVTYVSGSAISNNTTRFITFAAAGDAGATGATGGWDTSQTLTSITASTSAPTSSDNGKLVTIDTTTGAVTVTINTTLALSAGQRIDFAWIGAATSVTFATSGTTVNATPGSKLRARYSAATLICLSSNTYLLVGDLSA